MPTTARRPTNLSLDPDLLIQAKALKINLSRAAEDGVRRAVAQAQTTAWKAQNAEALHSSNAYVEAQGLPLDSFRRF